MGGHERMKWDALKEKKQVMFEKWVFIMIFLIDKSYKRITNVKTYWIVSVGLLRRVLEVGNDLQEFLVIAGGNKSVVQQQQQGTTSKASIAGRWFMPMFLI